MRLSVKRCICTTACSHAFKGGQENLIFTENLHKKIVKSEILTLNFRVKQWEKTDISPRVLLKGKYPLLSTLNF